MPVFSRKTYLILAFVSLLPLVVLFLSYNKVSGKSDPNSTITPYNNPIPQTAPDNGPVAPPVADNETVALSVPNNNPVAPPAADINPAAPPVADNDPVASSAPEDKQNCYYCTEWQKYLSWYSQYLKTQDFCFTENYYPK